MDNSARALGHAMVWAAAAIIGVAIGAALALGAQVPRPDPAPTCRLYGEAPFTAPDPRSENNSTAQTCICYTRCMTNQRNKKWNPRGEPTWPDFKRATSGLRLRHVRSGRTCTFLRWPVTQPGRNPGYAVVEWDNAVIGRVVAYAYDLAPLDDQ